jgi:hypothetical protein
MKSFIISFSRKTLSTNGREVNTKTGGGIEWQRPLGGTRSRLAYNMKMDVKERMW